VETQTDWTLLSTRKLRSELAKREKRLQRLLEEFPELAGLDTRQVFDLMAKYAAEPPPPLYSDQRGVIQRGPNGITYMEANRGDLRTRMPQPLGGKWREFCSLHSEIDAIKFVLFRRNKLRSQKRAPVAEPTERESKIGFTSRTAGNIDMFRKDCGWSLQELANQTGIDKKSIISHIKKGVKPTPRLLKEYAQAFSKGLNQPITPSKLEE